MFGLRLEAEVERKPCSLSADDDDCVNEDTTITSNKYLLPNWRTKPVLF